MADELARIKTLIRNLTSRTVDNGCTEAEAYAAMEMVGNLMGQYNVTMTDIELGDEECIHRSIATTGSNRSPIAPLVSRLGSSFGLRVWASRLHKKLVYNFFGLESDVDMAMYLYRIVDSALDYETTKFKDSDLWKFSSSRKTASTSFQKGFIARINQRIAEETKPRAVMSNGTDLVLAKKNKVENAFKKIGVRTVKSYSYESRRDYGSYHAGQDAGAKINLNRPLNNSDKPTLLIGRG